ncbi:hypothetical protein CW362_02765 [Streptomyces populi]|uniref:LPXTG cell wall anchor domain-containing protein n=1 Tax=Streptomyces populi TaxID=2058924 RepID=A0A2I0SX78_9ACTN|nr:hypothetical protein CW362_02765 [Streptomyces populi]
MALTRVGERSERDPGNSTAPVTVEAIGAPGGSGPTAWTVAAVGGGALVLTGLTVFVLVRRRGSSPAEARDRADAGRVEARLRVRSVPGKCPGGAAP